ncbi:hypothetical protein [uncultured Vagococcus sp.]|uniref:hypothetical protein n=1 Tax=uncultured Vagococcus sp. TaxID=189676 RepID=UPI002589E631|nr:hypothetical protein [uncultured Vagococcus sp.]
MKILDNIATKIADKVNAKNDEVMLLTQENDSLRQKLAASELTVSDYQKKIKKSDNQLKVYKDEWRNVEKEKERLESKYNEVKKRLKDLAESGERQVDVIQEYSERILELEEQLSAKSSDELRRKYYELIRISENQLKFIEILQVIASAKADKTKLKDVFSHNLRVYLDNNFNTMKQAENKLGINRTTLSELKSGKTALSYDNLDILDSKMCEYFECSVYELVTKKMEGKKNVVSKKS